MEIKHFIIKTWVLLLIVTTTNAQNIDNGTHNFKSLSELNPTVINSYRAKKLEDAKHVIKTERGMATFIVVEFQFKTEKACTTLLTPQSFACTTIFRTKPKMEVSRAICIGKHPGQILKEEQWIADGQSKLVYTFDENETLNIKVAFEVHKEVDEFEFYCLESLADFSTLSN